MVKVVKKLLDSIITEWNPLQFFNIHTQVNIIPLG